MIIKDLFSEQNDPTRQIEEVQKVKDRERARLEADVREFYETDSAREVLKELGEVIETHPENEHRFLYVEATFGSGKTHLLKLIGLVIDTDSEFSDLSDLLTTGKPGFDELSKSLKRSHVDRLQPVFLNLLDRDASKEPPLPFLIYEGMGDELGYPTDPNWLLEWSWKLDMEYDGIWEKLQQHSHNGKTLEDVLENKAYLRSWLYEALPSLPETDGTDLNTEKGVRNSIEEAEKSTEPEEFGPEDLVDRVETATDSLNDGSEEVELFLGLDEVSLFVGDSTHRYREFERTMEALQSGPNPVVVTTGQYSLPRTRERLVQEQAPESHWTRRYVRLEGTDTEIIVRERWLSKQSEKEVSEMLESSPDLSLETYSSFRNEDPDPVKSYPFREYDLTLLREIMQKLITQGRETDREYIQGRALLVLVRSLFTKFGWAKKEVGSVVTWDVLFDLLAEETPYIPLWVQEILSNNLIPTFDDEDAWEVRLAKALYLLNQSSSVPSTADNLSMLMVGGLNESVEEVSERTEQGLENLVDKRFVLTETTEEGNEVYKLVSEEQESILSRAKARSKEIAPHQLSDWLETRLRENDAFFRTDGTRHEVDIGNERNVPLRYEYSVLNPIDRAPTSEYDALRIRVLADDSDTVDDQVEKWQEANEDRDGGEHVLVAIDISETMLDRIRSVIGMGQVLDEATESQDELERKHRENKRRLKSSVKEVLEESLVYTVQGKQGKRSSSLEDVIKNQVQSVFAPTRRTLSVSLAEVEDAKAMSEFFSGGGEWPLGDRDAEELGVDIEGRRIGDSGWAREFIEEHEDKKSLDVEWLLRQTKTANGDYRGTPQESIAALLITLATSGEDVALKKDTEYVTDPDEIGRQVRNKTKLETLQIRFNVKIVDRGKIRKLVKTVVGSEPVGEGPDDWIEELGEWTQKNSATLKRTVRDIEREFGVSLELFSETIRPAVEGGDLSVSDIDGDEQLEEVIEEAETFDTGRDLLVTEDDRSLWGDFTETLETMRSLYPKADVTEGMRAAAEDDTVPSVATVRSRIEEANEYRVQQLSELYQKLTGEETSSSDPEKIASELTETLRGNETDIRSVLEKARDEFSEVKLGEVEEVFIETWENRDRDLQEKTLTDVTVIRQAETYERCRELFDSSETEDSLWLRLNNVYETLSEEHPRSPTTTSVENVLDSERPPTTKRVRQLLEQSQDPREPGPEGEMWAELQRVTEELRSLLPNADITEKATSVVDSDGQPTEQKTKELLEEAQEVLERREAIEEKLDSLEEGSVVVIHDS